MAAAGPLPPALRMTPGPAPSRGAVREGLQPKGVYR